MAQQTRMYIVRGVYRSGGLRGQSCSASFYSPHRASYLLRADAETQNPWLRPVSWGEVVGDYGGCPVSVLIAAHDRKRVE